MMAHLLIPTVSVFCNDIIQFRHRIKLELVYQLSLSGIVVSFHRYIVIRTFCMTLCSV